MATREEYERDQALLKEQHGYTEESDDSEISLPHLQEPEINPLFYKDVESLLFKGFITLSAMINGVLFVFKSLNHHELNYLTLLYDVENVQVIPGAFWNNFLAYGVLSVEGINVLRKREETLPELVTTFQALPLSARNDLIRYLSEINRRASNAVMLTEAYSMESFSRYRWAQVRGLDMSSPSVSGIPGTEQLGLNWAQLTWKAVNQFEDQKEIFEREWENAKFVGSCMAGKGVSKVYRQDENRRRKEKEERIARKDHLFRTIILREKTGYGTSKYGAPMVVASTVEDLKTQLERDLRGEKDFHDLVVDQYEQQQRERIAQQRKTIEEFVQKKDQEWGNQMLVGSTDFQGMTPEEVKDHLARRKAAQGQGLAQRMITPLTDERGAEFAKRWGLDQTDQDPSQATPIIQRKDQIKPFGKGKLQWLVISWISMSS